MACVGSDATTIATALRRVAVTNPSIVAVRILGARDEVVSAADLWDRSVRWAESLRHLGVRPGEVVFCIQKTGLDLIAAFLGAAVAGAVPAVLPFPTPKLDPVEYDQRIRLVTKHSLPAVIVTYPELRDRLARVLWGCTGLRAIATAADAEPPEPSRLDPAVPNEPTAPALLQYSSGTTGLQKGVMLSHRALFTQLANYSAAIRLSSSDVVVSWLPLYHDMGLIAGFLLPVLNGIPLVLMSPFDWIARPAMFFEATSRYAGTLSWLPNFAYSFLAQKVRDDELAGIRLDSIRALVNCSEPTRLESHESFTRRFTPYGLRSTALATCYAMAENTFAVTQSDLGRGIAVDMRDGAAVPRQLLSNGRPIPGVDVKIVDDGGGPLPARVVGQIAIRSECMLSEYYRRPDVTASAFADGWFLTGDNGYLADGELYVTGRRKDVIIVGGTNLYPQDVEAAVEGVPGVHPGRVVAFGLFDERLGTEQVAMVVELEPDAVADADRVRRAVRDRVAAATDCVVRLVHTVGPGWIIKTSSGKIARHANRVKFCAETERAG